MHYKGDNCRRDGLICLGLGAPAPEQDPSLKASVFDIHSDDQPPAAENETFLQVSLDEVTEKNTDSDHLWLTGLLAICACDTVPKTLLSRALNCSTSWGSNGELNLSTLCMNTLYMYPDSTFKLYGMTAGPSDSWRQRYTSNPEEVSAFCRLVPEPKMVLEHTMPKRPLDVLIVMMLALPEPHCEIAWEAVEDELWEVFESTCLPLLGVITLEDLINHFARYSM